MKKQTLAALGVMVVSMVLGSGTSLFAAVFYWDADGDATTAVGGNGIWDTTNALWRAGSATGVLSVWPNSSPNSDQAVLSGTTGTLTIAAGTTLYVNDILLALGNRFFLADGDEDSLLVFSGSSPRVSQNANNTALTFRNRLNVGSTGISIEQTGTANGGILFDRTNQLEGTGPVEIRMGSSQYGAHMTINTPQENFSGGFRVAEGRRRNVTLRAVTTNSLGSGAARATGFGLIHLNVWGAQMPVGGVPAGIHAFSNATIRLPDTAASDTKERFVIGANAALAGNSSALPSVTRVFSFSTSPVGPEALFSRGTVVLHLTANSSTSVGGLGTDSDLFFGLGADFTATGFSLTIGKGTPWQGLSNTTTNNPGTGSLESRLQTGTISIASGTDAITLQGFGVDYNYNSCALILGNGTVSPVITAAGDPCLAYIVRHVKIDTSAPNFSGISHFWLKQGSRLSLLRDGASASKPATLENGSLIHFLPTVAGSSTALGTTTIRGQATLYVTRKTAGTADTMILSSLVRTNQGVLRVGTATAGQLGGDERIMVTDTNGLIRGNIVDPWIQGVGEYLAYGPNGFIVYPSYVTSLASLGNGVVFKGSGTLSANSTLDSMIMSGTINGSYKLTAGVLPDGSRAARVGLMGTADNISLAAAFDSGDGELLVHYPQGGTRTLSLNGAIYAKGLTKTGTGIASLRNNTNVIQGAVMIWEGTLRVDNNGNGLEPDATVFVAKGATYDILAPLGNAETNAVVSGAGTINIAAGKTLAVTNRLECGDGQSSLLVTGTGTLRLTGSSSAVFALDYATDTPLDPRLAAGSATLDLSATPKVVVASVENLPSGDFEKTFTLIQFGGRSGAFAGTVECPAGLKGTLSYDDTAKIISVTLTRSKAKGSVIALR